MNVILDHSAKFPIFHGAQQLLFLSVVKFIQPFFFICRLFAINKLLRKDLGEK